MDRPDFLTDPKYATVNVRAKYQEEIIAEIEAWLSTFPNMDAAIEHMMACDVPCCKINNDQDVVNDPQVKHMGYIVQAPTPDDVTSRDTFLTRGPNAFFSETPGYIHKAATPRPGHPRGALRPRLQRGRGRPDDGRLEAQRRQGLTSPVIPG